MNERHKEQYEEAMAALEARYPWDCAKHDQPWWRWLCRIRDYVRQLEEENVAVSEHSKWLMQEMSRKKKEQEAR